MRSCARYCTANPARSLLVGSALSLVLLLTNCSNNRDAVSSGSDGDTSVARMIHWVTTGDTNMLLERQPAAALGAPGETAIIIDSNKKYQTIDGFGYSLTGGSAFVINRMTPEAKQKLLHELFGDTDQGIGVSYLRVSI